MRENSRLARCEKPFPFPFARGVPTQVLMQMPQAEGREKENIKMCFVLTSFQCSPPRPFPPSLAHLFKNFSERKIFSLHFLSDDGKPVFFPPPPPFSPHSYVDGIFLGFCVSFPSSPRLPSYLLHPFSNIEKMHSCTRNLTHLSPSEKTKKML